MAQRKSVYKVKSGGPKWELYGTPEGIGTYL